MSRAGVAATATSPYVMAPMRLAAGAACDAARAGTVFEEDHCQGSMHPAVCVPSRASLMTGRNIFASSTNPSADDYTDGQSECPAFTIPPDLPTFPQRLREAGYRTHAIGKWHNDRAAFARSFSSGDRIFFGGMSDHDQVPLNAFDPTGRYAREDITFEEGLSTDLFADSARGSVTATRITSKGDGSGESATRI